MTGWPPSCPTPGRCSSLPRSSSPGPSHSSPPPPAPPARRAPPPFRFPGPARKRARLDRSRRLRTRPRRLGPAPHVARIQTLPPGALPPRRPSHDRGLSLGGGPAPARGAHPPRCRRRRGDRGRHGPDERVRRALRVGPAELVFLGDRRRVRLSRLVDEHRARPEAEPVLAIRRLRNHSGSRLLWHGALDEGLRHGRGGLEVLRARSGRSVSSALLPPRARPLWPARRVPLPRDARLRALPPRLCAHGLREPRSVAADRGRSLPPGGGVSTPEPAAPLGERTGSRPRLGHLLRLAAPPLDRPGAVSLR